MEIIEQVGTKILQKKFETWNRSFSCKFLSTSFYNQMDNLAYWLVILRVAYRRTIILFKSDIRNAEEQEIVKYNS